jgi:hypothetical protein
VTSRRTLVIAGALVLLVVAVLGWRLVAAAHTPDGVLRLSGRIEGDIEAGDTVARLAVLVA